MKKLVYKPSLFRPSPQLLSSRAASSNYIVKVMKLLYDVQEASITRFAIYYPHYKNKLSNLTWSFIFATDNLHSLCNLSNLSTAFIYATKLGLVIKKWEPPRTSLYLLSYSPLSSFLSSTFSKMYMAMSNWQISSILASFLLLADNSLATLTSKAFLNFSHATQTIEILLDNIALLNK